MIDSKTENAYENAQDAEMEKQKEANDAQQVAIESRIEGLWQDKAMICEAIEENLINIVLANDIASDVAGRIEEIIDNYFESISIDELNL